MLGYLITSILPTLRTELPSPNAAGYDMTESFLGAMRDFVLAQAQECFWQQAVMRKCNFSPHYHVANAQRVHTRIK